MEGGVTERSPKVSFRTRGALQVAFRFALVVCLVELPYMDAKDPPESSLTSRVLSKRVAECCTPDMPPAFHIRDGWTSGRAA